MRKTIRKEHNLAGFRDSRSKKSYDKKFSCLEIPENEVWISDAINRFDKLLSDLGVETIPVNGISINDILDDYFNQNPPFEEKKSCEFKDAIFIRSIILEIEHLSEKNNKKGSNDHSNLIFKQEFAIPWRRTGIDGGEYSCSDDLIYCIVSQDKGARKALEQISSVRPNEDVKVFESLSNLLDFLARQDRLSFVVGELLEHGYAAEEIYKTVRGVIEDSDIDIEGYEGYIEEIEVESVEVNNVSIDVLMAQEFEDKSCITRFVADVAVSVELCYSYINEDMSPWDRETKSYLWRVMNINKAEYATGIQVIMDLDISRLGIDWNIDTATDEGQKKLDAWAKQKAVISDISWMPDSIFLYEGDCINCEKVGSRDIRD